MFSVSSSSESSVLNSQQSVRTRALRDRNSKVDYNASTEFKKQLRGANMKRKCPVRTLDKSEHLTNFSDFDNYSLVVSDSPVETRTHRKAKEIMETSTPVSKRTRHHTSPLKDYPVDMPSPVSDTIDTPDSDRSCSTCMFNTPSVLSSQYSKDGSNYCSAHSSISDSRHLSRLSDRSNPMIILQRMSKNLIQNVLSGNPPRQLRSNTINHDLSASLFSTPGLLETSGKPVLLLSSLDKIRDKNLLNDVSDESSEDGDDSGEESEETDDEDSEVDEDEETDEEHSELSAIHEDSEGDCEESEDESSEETNSTVNGVDDESCNDVSSELLPTVNLERLSESLLMHHVIDRRRGKRARGRVCRNEPDEEVLDIVEQLEKSHIDDDSSTENQVKWS